MDSERETECIFCAAVRSSDDQENLLLQRGKHSFVILNRYPYTSGHLMVVPYEHQPLLLALDRQTRGELMDFIACAEFVLDSTYHAEGYNIGVNIGVAAGAGIASHLHFHVVPRWSGDTNFMSTLGNTRVLPEELGETYRRLFEAWNNNFGSI